MHTNEWKSMYYIQPISWNSSFVFQVQKKKKKQGATEIGIH